MEHRQVVTECLATGGGGNDDNILTLERSVHGLRLVAIQVGDAVRLYSLLQQRVQGWRQGSILRWARRQRAPDPDVRHELGVMAKISKEVLDGHGQPGAFQDSMYKAGSVSTLVYLNTRWGGLRNPSAQFQHPKARRAMIIGWFG